MARLNTSIFWADAAERAVKTIAQSLLATMFVADQALNILSLNWEQAVGVALGAGVISILTSIISATVTASDSASLAVSTAPKQ